MTAKSNHSLAETLLCVFFGTGIVIALIACLLEWWNLAMAGAGFACVCVGAMWIHDLLRK